MIGPMTTFRLGGRLVTSCEMYGNCTTCFINKNECGGIEMEATLYFNKLLNEWILDTPKELIFFETRDEAKEYCSDNSVIYLEVE